MAKDITIRQFREALRVFPPNARVSILYDDRIGIHPILDRNGETTKITLGEWDLLQEAEYTFVADGMVGDKIPGKHILVLGRKKVKCEIFEGPHSNSNPLTAQQKKQINKTHKRNAKRSKDQRRSLKKALKRALG